MALSGKAGLERPATLGSLEGGARHKVVGGMKYERSSYGISPNPPYLSVKKVVRINSGHLSIIM